MACASTINHVSWVFSFFVAAAMVCIIFFLTRKKSCSKNKKQLPPGEMGIPWIGETIQFFKAQRKNRLFEDFFQPRITKHGKIFKTSLFGSSTVVMNGAEANRFVLSNEFKLVISSWPSSSVQLMGKDCIMQKQGEQHRCLRGLISTTLSQSAGMEALVPKICNSVQLHLDRYWRGQDRLHLYRSTKILTFTIVFECLLGIKVEAGMLERFERVLEGVFAPAISFPGSRFSRAKKARMGIQKILVKVVRDKRMEMEGGGQDGDHHDHHHHHHKEGMLLSQLVAGMICGDITEEEVIDNVVLLVFAAHDTTSFAIAMTFKLLAQYPNSHSLLLQEHTEIMREKKSGEVLRMEDIKKMKYTWQVARESMRLFPPIFGSFRKAVADIEYDGFTIPPYAFLPFGGGPRVCAGYQLAKLNILVFVHFVVTRYDWSLLCPDESITMDPLPFPSQGMPIKISPKL